MSDLSRGLARLASSAPAYETAEGYYKGTVKEFFASEAIRRKLDRADAHFRLQFSAVVVDARIDRIKIASITVPGNDALTKTLNASFVEANDLDADLEDFFRQAAFFGDYYMTVWEGEGDVDEDGNGIITSVDVFGNSPLSTAIVYSRENSRKALFGIKVWEADDSSGKKPRYRANLYYRDRTEQYITAEGKKGDDADDYEPYVDEDDEDSDDGGVIDNPYNKLPIFHFRQGGKPYGVPVHFRTYGAQDAVNKLTTTHMSTVDYTGFPQRYALLDSETEADEGDDWVDFETSGVQSTDTRESVDLVKKKSKLKSGPGETWWLEGVKSVGQFDAAGHEPFLEPIKFHVQAMSVLGRTPLDEFKLGDVGEAPSGESRRRADAPLVNSVEAMKRSYGQTVENAASFALEILGHPDVKVEVKWTPSELSSGEEDWKVIGLKLEHGVPLRVALEEAGYAAELIEDWYPDDGPALSPSQLVLIGQALGSLGQGVTLGAVTLDDIIAAIPNFFGDDRPEAGAVRLAPTAEVEVPVVPGNEDQ